MNHHNLPARIGNYRLKKRFVGEQFNSAYSLGLYKDSRGEIYFAKRWVGEHKNIAYKWLYNEAKLYVILSREDHHLSISTPRFIDLVEDNHSLTLFIEYIQGEQMANLPAAKKAKIYVDILHSLSNYVLQDSITNRPPFYWLALTPFTSLIAAIKHPDHYKDILRGLAFVIKHSYLLLNRRQRSLVHRDLNDNNIILSKGKIYLIDFELAVTGDPLIDLAIIMLKKNCDSSFIAFLKKHVYVKNTLTNPANDQTTIVYMTIFSLYDLCFSAGLHKESLIHLKSL